LLVNLDECLAYHLHELMNEKQKDAKDKKLINYDDNLARVLDRLILYLRVVHSVDYYACRIYPEEDDEPRRISTFTLRDDATRMSKPKRLAHYIRAFESRLKTMLPVEGRLAGEHVEVLGKKNIEQEVTKFCQANIIALHDGMSKCCLCYKRFESDEFALSHMNEKHIDKIEEVKWVVLTFNNYLLDASRPSNPLVTASDTDTQAQKHELLDAAIKKDEKIVHAAPTPEGVAFTGMFAPPPMMTEPIKLD